MTKKDRPAWAKKVVADNPSESTKAKLREFKDLYRGGPDGVRGNATACYMHLHPKAKRDSAEPRAHVYFNHPYTQELLAEDSERLTKECDVTQAMVLNELRKLAFFDIRKLYDDDGNPKAISELDDDTAAAITGLDAVNIGNSDSGIGSVLKYKLADKKGALELFGKHLKLWTDKSEVTVNGGKSLADLVKQARDESE